MVPYRFENHDPTIALSIIDSRISLDTGHVKTSLFHVPSSIVGFGRVRETASVAKHARYLFL